MKKIKLVNINKYAVVDDEDFLKFRVFCWHLDRKGYAKCLINTKDKKTQKHGIKSIFLHREIMKAPNGKQIDHTNRNKLDNRKLNLRFCSYSENLSNRGLTKNNTSGFKGVGWNRRDKIFRAIIAHNKVRHYLRSFKDPKDAARAYNEAAKKYHGEFAFLNKV